MGTGENTGCNIGENTGSSGYRSSTSPTSQRLLQSADLTYVGAFDIPSSPTETFLYGGMALAVSADGASLYAGGHVYDEILGRISIPDPISNDDSSLITDLTYIPGDPYPSPGDAQEICAALVYNEKLIVTKRDWYDNDGTGETHAVGDLDITGFSSFIRLANLAYAAFGNGYMGHIPSEWQSLLGGPCFTGNSSMSIISKCSSGPTFYAFDPDDIGVTAPIPSTPLMWFNLTDPILDLDTDAANDWWIRADTVNNGMAFPSGTRSVLFISRHGYGDRTYKTDSRCGAGGGEGAWPYRRQVTAFDANDLLAVKNGEINPHDVEPYVWWTLPGPEASCADMTAGGCAYDPITRRIFITEGYGGSTPEVHVFQVS